MEIIYNCIVVLLLDVIKEIILILFSILDVIGCLGMINVFKVLCGLVFVDMIMVLLEELVKFEVVLEVMILWLEGLVDIEYCVVGGGSEMV